LPQTPLGELTALHTPLAGFKGSYFKEKGMGAGKKRERKRKKGEREGREGSEGGGGKRRGKGGERGDSPYQF